MSEYHRPDQNEFREGACIAFSELMDEYEYKVCKSPLKYQNPYSIFFKKQDIFVYVEGLSYGFSLGVSIGKLGFFRTIQEQVLLEHIVSFRRPELLESQYPESRGQLEQIKRSASMLYGCATDFLKGDFSELPLIKEHIEQLDRKNKEEEEVKEMRGIGIRVSRAFHSKNYEDVIDILSPVEFNLNRVQLLLLAKAKKQITISGTD